MKETPKHQDFKITIDGKPAFFASNVTIAQAIDEDTTKDLDGFAAIDYIAREKSRPWTVGFSVTSTLELPNDTNRLINQIFGRIRPNRGSSRNMNQRLIRMAHYYRKIGVPWYIKPVYTLADYRISNPNKPPF